MQQAGLIHAYVSYEHYYLVYPEHCCPRSRAVLIVHLQLFVFCLPLQPLPYGYEDLQRLPMVVLSNNKLFVQLICERTVGCEPWIKKDGIEKAESGLPRWQKWEKNTILQQINAKLEAKASKGPDTWCNLFYLRLRATVAEVESSFTFAMLRATNCIV